MKTPLVAALLLSSLVAVRADWRADADARIARIRQDELTLRVVDAAGRPIPGAKVEYALQQHAFLFGTAIAHGPFADGGARGKAYRQFILEHFNGLVCENEMKWYATEGARGTETYATADALLAFAQQHGLRMRGHCLVWEKTKYTQEWLQALERPALQAAVDRRLQSVVSRYAGKLVCWDGNNEMLDGSFYEERLGADGRAWIYREAARVDPKTPLFVNEYGILGNAEKTGRYLELIRKLQSQGAPIAGVGIQSHDSDRFTSHPAAADPNGQRPQAILNDPLTPEAFLGTLDLLHRETKLPIHLTEVSAKVADAEQRGVALETLFRLGFSHPGVDAILLWGFDAKTHWMGPDAALLDADGTSNAAGRRIGRLLREEWTTRGAAATNPQGEVLLRGFHGTYRVTVRLPDGTRREHTVELTRAAPAAVVR